MRTLALAPWALVLALTTAGSSEAGQETSAAAEIEAIDAKFVAAVNKGNLEEIVALYAENAIVMSPAGPDLWHAGTSSIRKSFADFFTAFETPTIKIHHAKYKMSGDLGYGMGLFDLSYKDATTGKMMTLKGRWSSIFEKRDGKWVYVVDHASIPMPPAPGASTVADPVAAPGR
jgi:ketosteroid isomerase-like protein